MLITSFTQKIEYVANKRKSFYHLTTLYYKKIIEREVNLAKINSDDRILCIGGGPCPYTAILMHQLTGASITVIDNNKFCVKQSKKLINRMRLDDVIRIFWCDGESICCQGYNVIHLTLQITPKEEVLHRILQHADDGTKILVRMPKKHLNHLYCNMNQCPLLYREYVKHDIFTNVGNTTLYIKDGL